VNPRSFVELPSPVFKNIPPVRIDFGKFAGLWRSGNPAITVLERSRAVLTTAQDCQCEAGQNRLMFQSECMLARKFTRAPLCPRQWADATMKSELSQNRPARSSLVPDGER
jgi:hypothetical protein